ncbi:hypothetical protein OAM67_01030 [bacterium]|nr:hypothetical protein [bacterium]
MPAPAFDTGKEVLLFVGLVVALVAILSASAYTVHTINEMRTQSQSDYQAALSEAASEDEVDIEDYCFADTEVKNPIETIAYATLITSSIILFGLFVWLIILPFRTAIARKILNGAKRGGDPSEQRIKAAEFFDKKAVQRRSDAFVRQAEIARANSEAAAEVAAKAAKTAEQLGRRASRRSESEAPPRIRRFGPEAPPRIRRQPRSSPLAQKLEDLKPSASPEEAVLNLDEL